MTPDDGERLHALTLAVEDLRAQRELDRSRLDEVEISLAAGRSAIERTDSVYPDWISWVEEWLAVRISRRQQRIRWCRRYTEHPEVADRLEALWYAWEAQWPDPELRITWFRDGLDHQLAVITAEDGPLRECSAHENAHARPPTLHD